MLVFVKVNFKLISVSKTFKLGYLLGHQPFYTCKGQQIKQICLWVVFYVFLYNLDQQGESGLKYSKIVISHSGLMRVQGIIAIELFIPGIKSYICLKLVLKHTCIIEIVWEGLEGCSVIKSMYCSSTGSVQS